jgi:nicotinamidase-related amidase
MERRLTFGSRPAVLVVDFSCGFTDPESLVGSDVSDAVEATRRVLDTAREHSIPIVFTMIGFEPGAEDAGLWTEKSPNLATITVGTRWVTTDPRLDPRPEDVTIIKKGASAFFGTNLAAILVTKKVDTVILCGATTSGCIRATAIDLMQYGWPGLVPRECVADRAPAPHEASLFDMQAKYVEVVALTEAIDYLQSVGQPVS